MSKTLEQIEAERLSRRQALGRIGFLAGAAAVAALTSDELLRKVGAEMQKRAGDSQVANQVAKELRGAGVAMATGQPNGSSCVCNSSHPPGYWWVCKSCSGADSLKLWPALDCDPVNGDTQTCCQQKYDACMANYGSGASTTCQGKLDECKARIAAVGGGGGTN